MEMVQFHPTGLLAGPGTRMTGTVLEEGLRGSGGYLLDETGERFMFDYDKRGERATRDIVCRGVADRIRKGHASPNGGVYISMGHLGAGQRAARVQGHGRALRRLRLRSRRRQGRGGADRALHDGRRAVQRRLHAPRCRGSTRPARTPAACTAPTGSAATASPTRRCSAGLPATAWRRRCAPSAKLADPDKAAIEAAHERAYAPLGRRRGDLESVRRRLYQVMWDDVGILRTADGLARAPSRAEQPRRQRSR